MKLGFKKKKSEKAAAAGAPEVRAGYYDVLRSHVITEKSTAASHQNKVVFNVADHADKKLIKTAVEALFGVQVTKVNTLVRKGKAKGFRGRSGQQSDVKKAVITLAEGQHIDFTAGAR